ncbi:MAG: tripartite tricarboxylate transporter TctB family protein [Deltaproteobacteria bacterium]|nr:MAG: tripartite tricarboxylate transporter TctB family protein [Deltaproteobacteria bacterium]
MSQAQRDLMMGVLLLIFAITFFVLTYHFYGYELEEIPQDVGAGFLPRLLLVALAVQAVFLIFFSLRDHMKSQADATRPKALFQVRPFIMFGAFLVYVYLATLFGYVISTMAFMVLGFYLLGVRSLWPLILIPPAITLASYYLFGTLLNVFLPSGSLF